MEKIKVKTELSVLRLPASLSAGEAVDRIIGYFEEVDELVLSEIHLKYLNFRESFSSNLECEPITVVYSSSKRTHAKFEVGQGDNVYNYLRNGEMTHVEGLENIDLT